ncbi:hypothetical protein BOTBODRAFT_115887 [Botryobasidium botryosum FD-172 SS1]|uniref:Prolyl 4-hydroxylase alpha subunit Fe(2+) 2OG dioxygenase domain-containing protein n=1 Tax=Botryobasidium botryosum (strain FD-172 SS1) TaxID=930990 RepID=A0A067M3R0_BOTB1|nr:hypothetical protein BOTBODRAFT_115887 [Botryobasidium botryosum FD-172 SS1]
MLQQSLADTLLEQNRNPVYCSGTWRVTSDDVILFYGESEGTRFVVFATTATNSNRKLKKCDSSARRLALQGATPAQLEHLANSCDKATFGVDQEDVLDESYRKAGKLDADHFAWNFQATDLVDRIKKALFALDLKPREIRAELYKLNVYGPGSFFKSHKDTPRGEDMFGSLVVVLPTRHEGGELYLRHGGKEWVYDSASELANVSEGDGPRIGYVALYSDVEHEVASVRSGYRVTITYNLYFASEQNAPSPKAESPPSIEPVAALLEGLLAQPDFLPKGGLLGFGLLHEYPFPQRKRTATSIAPLEAVLKGSDRIIMNAVRQLGLEAALYIVYRATRGAYDFGYDTEVISQEYIQWSTENEVEDLNGELVAHYGGIVTISKYREDAKREWGWKEMRKEEHPITWITPKTTHNSFKDDMRKEEYPITWVTPKTTHNSFKDAYLAYGNQASLGYVYGTMVPVAKIGGPGARHDLTILKRTKASIDAEWKALVKEKAAKRTAKAVQLVEAEELKDTSQPPRDEEDSPLP